MGTGVGEAMLIGAAVGGGSSALMGGDPIKGAMLGAAGGGLGAGFGAAAGGASGATAGGASGATSGGFGGITAGSAGAGTGATFGSLGAGAGSGATFGSLGVGAAPGALSGAGSGIAGSSLGAGSSILAGSANPALYGMTGAGTGAIGGVGGGAGIGAGTSMISPGTMSLANAAGPGNFTGFAPALSNTKLGFIAGSGALSGMMDAERDKFGIPGEEDYKSSFDISKFRRSEPTYAPGSVYVPEYRDYTAAAEGGIMKAYQSGGPVERMSMMNTAMNPQGGLYPQGMIDKTQYATPTQRPVSAEMVSEAPAYERSDPMLMNEGGIAEILESAKNQGLSPEMYQNIYGRGNRIVAMQKALKEGKMVNGMASGGISSLGGYSDGGRMLKGPGDGMSDSIPGVIAGRQPARLADGEFVVPADVVSHLGNGSTDAGAKRLYGMMDKVRKARTGKKKQAPAVKANKYMPA
jgi:hypothetical protein